MEPPVTATLRVTAPDRELATVTVRRHQFRVGRPLELDDASPRIAALEYALGALAAEAVNGLRVFARRTRIEIDDIEALVSAELTRGLSYLEVVGVEGPPTIARIRLQVFVSAPDEAAVRQLWARLLDRLPLACTLRLAVPLDYHLSISR